MLAFIRPILCALLIAEGFSAAAQDSPLPQGAYLELPSPEEFREKLSALKRAATRSSFDSWHGAHVRGTTWAVKEPWGYRLPNPDKYGPDDAAMRGGYYTYNASFGTAQFYLLEGEVEEAELAMQLRRELVALEQIFHEVLWPWEVQFDDPLTHEGEWTVSLEAMPKISEWGPSIRFFWKVEPVPHVQGARKFQVSAKVLALATRPEEALPSGEGPRPEQLASKPLIDDLAKNDAAWAFARALRAADREAIERQVFRYAEMLVEDQRRRPDDSFADEPEQELREFHASLVDQIGGNFEFLQTLLRETYPVVDLDRLRLVAVTSYAERRAELGEENDDWSWEDFEFVEYFEETYDGDYDEILALTFAADYPGSESLEFDLELVLIDVGSHYAIAGMGEEASNVQSKGIDEFLASFSRAILGGEFDDYLELVTPTHIDALLVDDSKSIQALDWWWEHRCPAEQDDITEPADFAWDDRSQWRRLHLARASLEDLGWDHASAWEIDAVEVVPAYTVGATEQLWVTASLMDESAQELSVSFQVEVMHHGPRFSLHPNGRFELDVQQESPRLSDAGRIARSAVSDLSGSRQFSKPEKRLSYEELILAGIHELPLDRQAAAYIGLASARAEKFFAEKEGGAETPSVESLIQAAHEFDQAHLAMRQVRGEAEWMDRGIALDSAQTSQELRSIVIECVTQSSATEDAGLRMRMYEAAARAGSWLNRFERDGIESACVQCAQAFADHAMQNGQVDAAFEVIRRYFPVDSETAILQASSFAEQYGIGLDQVAASYAALGVLRYNRAVALYQESQGEARPLPARAWQAVDEAVRATKAFRLAKKAGSASTNVAEQLQQAEQLIETLSAAAVESSF